MKLLIASPNKELSQELPKVATKNGYLLDFVTNGKDCQMRLYKGDYSIVILDLDVTNHSSFEVLKYIKLNHLSVKVLLYVQTMEKFKTLDLSEKDLNRMGVSQTFISTSSLSSMFKFLKEFNYASSWKDIRPDSSVRSDGVLNMPDNQFTRIKSIDFMGGTLSVFDLYLRLGENRFIKILNVGEGLNPERLMKYVHDGIEFFYFLTKERAIYINYMNELSKKMTSNLSTERARVVIKNMSSVSEQFIEEVYTKGIQHQLVLEAKGICDNMYSLIKNDEALSLSIDEYTGLNPDSFSHIFLNAFFSIIICKNLSWVGPKTREAVAMGSLLHDIGMLKVPAAIREKNPSQMTVNELAIYKCHPKFGYEMLQKSKVISEQVKQIVLQHHECVSGKGFPHGSNGINIYPLAKIVALSDGFSYILKKERVTPKEGIRIFLRDREKIMDYDPYVIKALIQGFVKG